MLPSAYTPESWDSIRTLTICRCTSCPIREGDLPASFASLLEGSKRGDSWGRDDQ